LAASLLSIKYSLEEAQQQERSLKLDNRVFQLDSRSVAVRAILSIAAALVLGIGVRLAYEAYRTEKIIEACIGGASCPYNVTGFQLGSMLSSTKGQLYIGLGLAVLGLIGLIYFILLASLTTKSA
jgi:cell division protein FtsX